MYHYVLPLLSQLPFPHCVKGKASWILLRHFTPGCKKTKGPQVNDASETSFIESNKTCGRISSISLLWYISRVKSEMRNNVFWSVSGCFELSKHRVRQLEWWFLIDAELYVFHSLTIAKEYIAPEWEDSKKQHKESFVKKYSMLCDSFKLDDKFLARPSALSVLKLGIINESLSWDRICLFEWNNKLDIFQQKLNHIGLMNLTITISFPN